MSNRLTVTDFIKHQIADLSGAAIRAGELSDTMPVSAGVLPMPSLIERIEGRYGIDLAGDLGGEPSEITVLDLRNLVVRKVKSQMSSQVDSKTIFENFVFNGRCKRLTSPYELNIDVTFRCNLRCIFCYADAVDSKAAQTEMTTDEIIDVVDQFAAAGGAFILFGGGEPFVREDFLEIYKFAKSKGLWTYIISNGTLLTPDVVREFAKYHDPVFDKIQLSLDGSCPSIHDKQRGVKGAFEMTLNGLRNLVAAGIRPLLNTVVTTLNIDDVPNMLDLAVAENAYTYRCLKLHKIGRGNRGILHERISPPLERAEKMYKFLESRREELLGVVGIASDNACVFPLSMEEVRASVEKKPGVEPASYACAAGTTKLAVAPDGGVVPCSYFYDFPELYIGSLRERSLMDIWEDESLWTLYREPLKVEGKCRQCGYLHACKTGCRIMAYAATGKMGAPDSGCTYDPEKDSWAGNERQKERS